ncbi:MAG: hydrolase, partial [Planctomycetes bacterium]|nr:hydrolase [Planctomycetota bacterium]
MELEEAVKKGILCYGDSNTWGYVPGGDGARFPSHVRWPGVLSKLLRTNYRITEEGLNGRTTS